GVSMRLDTVTATGPRAVRVRRTSPGRNASKNRRAIVSGKTRATHWTGVRPEIPRSCVPGRAARKLLRDKAGERRKPGCKIDAAGLLGRAPPAVCDARVRAAG